MSTILILYFTLYRELCRKVCGWVSQIIDDSDEHEDRSVSEFDDDIGQDLLALISECEMIDGFERASALALFHGNIALAVQVCSHLFKKKLLFIYIKLFSIYRFWKSILSRTPL